MWQLYIAQYLVVPIGTNTCPRLTKTKHRGIGSYGTTSAVQFTVGVSTQFNQQHQQAVCVCGSRLTYILLRIGPNGVQPTVSGVSVSATSR